MSGRVKRLANDRKVSRLGWLKKRKQSLRLHCSDCGLSTAGTKEDLVERLRSHLSALNSPVDEQSDNVWEDVSSVVWSDVPAQPSTPSSAQPVNHAAPDIGTVSTVPLDVIRELIRQEVSLAVDTQLSRQQNTVSQLPMISQRLADQLQHRSHLASVYHLPRLKILPIKTDQVCHILFLLYLQSTSYGRQHNQLPPLSEKMLSDIKGKQSINFNLLLSTALYDPVISSDNICLEVNQSRDGGQSPSLQPNRRLTQMFQMWWETPRLYMHFIVNSTHCQLQPLPHL